MTFSFDGATSTCDLGINLDYLIPGTDYSTMILAEVADIPGRGFQLAKLTAKNRPRYDNENCASLGGVWFKPLNFQDLELLDALTFTGKDRLSAKS